MVQITDIDPQSNEYFFITGLRNDTFKAGRNSFVVNSTPKILANKGIAVTARDAQNKSISISQVYGDTYILYIPADAVSGVGKLQITGVGIDTGTYTGSFAFYQNKAYAVSDTQRLPLVSAPVGVEPFPEVEVVWTRNFLIDVTGPTESEVRFFDFPSLTVYPKIYNAPDYPVASYRLATGSCSSIAVYPRNNDVRVQVPDQVLYQLYHSAGTKFNSSMENEEIRIKTPYVRNFTYSNYNNTEINYSGVLQGDFIATIKKVVNDTTLLIDIPFSVATELANRSQRGESNEDSIYNRNNLVDPFGYNMSDDPAKQTVFFKKNFFTLSIASANFEVVYKNIPTVLTQSIASGSIPVRKSTIEVEFNNVRTYCGNLDRYEIYGRSLNSPESKTLLASGKIEEDDALILNNFNNGYYNSAGKFYSRTHMNRFWVTSSIALTFSQSHAVLIDGARIGHSANTDKAHYVILKDDTSTKSSTVIPPTFVQKSYWYGTRDAFLNSAAQSSASYDSIANISILGSYASSRENQINGTTYDANPIKLRRSTLYRLSLNVKATPENTQASQLFIYFVTGDVRKQIGMIDGYSGVVVDGVYTTTFFSDVVQYGTIVLVPVSGYWDISNLSLCPHKAMDYSVDSFSAKIPFPTFVKNELFEVEAELYDSSNRLAYGKGSYSFNYNKMYAPLKKQFFVNPLGIIFGGGAGGSSDIIIDGGLATTPDIEYTSTLDGGSGSEGDFEAIIE